MTGKFVVEGALDKLGVGTGPVSVTAARGDLLAVPAVLRRTNGRASRSRCSRPTSCSCSASPSAAQTPAKIDAVAQGRVWTGRQARELGLVDELGGLDAALQIAQQRARLDVNKRPNLVVYPQRRSVYEILANPLGMTFGARLGLTVNRPERQAINRPTLAARLFRPASRSCSCPTSSGRTEGLIQRFGVRGSRFKAGSAFGVPGSPDEPESGTRGTNPEP